MDLHIRRQYLSVQFIGFGFDAFQNALRLLASEHQNHAFNRIVILLYCRVLVLRESKLP
jgi:hypothetical protein